MDLGNPNNWAKIHTWNLRANLVAKYGEGIGALEVYEPIPDVWGAIASPIGLLRTYARSDEIKPNWFKACRLTAYLSFSPEAGTDSIFSKNCGLNQGTYLQLPDFGAYPYRVRLQVPDWIINLDIDLWQFTSESGKYDQSNQTAILSAIEVVEQRTNELAKTVQLIADRDVVKNYDVNPG
jgi:hypothetical protein